MISCGTIVVSLTFAFRKEISIVDVPLAFVVRVERKIHIEKLGAFGMLDSSKFDDDNHL